MMVGMKHLKSVPSSASSTPRSWLTLAVLLLALVYPRHEWDHYYNVNETARIYLVQAIVDRGVFYIDDGIRQYRDVHDKAEHGGHFYCDKPIGLSLVAVPVYAVLRAIGSITGHVWTPGQIRYLLTVSCVSLPTVAAAWWLGKYWKSLTQDAVLAQFSVLAYGLGTICFTYATQFMGHQLAAVWVVAHFAVSRKLAQRMRHSTALLAGLLAGLGAITDYFSGFLHLLIACSYLFQRAGFADRGARHRLLTGATPGLAAWAAGAAVGVCPLLIYNTVCFGGPLKMAYAHESLGVFQELHSTGLLGVTHPTLESIWGLLFSAPKGLFFISPFLVLAVCGLLPGLRDPAIRRECLVATACVAAITYLAASLNDWRAGSTVGPRHMVTMLPFLMTLVVLGVARSRALLPWFAGTAILGMAFVGIATLTQPAFEKNFENPIASQAWFLFGSGLVSPNLGQLIGLSGALSLGPLAALLIVAMIALGRSAGAAGRRVVCWPSAGACLLALGWFIAVVMYEPDHPRLHRLLQGRMLWQVDQLPRAGANHEAALEGLETDQALTAVSKRELLDATVPNLIAIYQELGDQSALDRLKARIERMGGSDGPRN